MHKSAPLISVVMASYNGEKFLPQQINSVLEQTYANLEIIISDDCSTDNTWNIIRQYAENNERIIASRNEINLGYIKNFEKAVRQCRGDYVAFCDQDDIWCKEKISLLMDTIKHHDLCFCDSEFIDEAGQRLYRNLSDIKQLNAYTNCLPFLRDNCISGHAMLVKKETLLLALPFPDFLVYDWYIAFFVACKGSIVYLNQPLVQYRQHRDAAGAIRIKERPKKKKILRIEIKSIRERLKLFYEIAERLIVPESMVLKNLHESYQSFSFTNNLKRSSIFFSHRNQLLAIKKKSATRKWLFCFKMFFKIH